MPNPDSLRRLPPGIKWAPSALDNVPSDWADRYAAGNPYVPIVAPHDTHAGVPVIEYIPLVSVVGETLSPVTVEDGSGGFAIVFTEGGEVVYASGS